MSAKSNEFDEDSTNAKLSQEQRELILKRDAELDAQPELAMTWKQIRKQVESKRELAD